MTHCRVCHTKRHKSQFYKACINKAGTVGECKECTQARVKKNRAEKADYYREYDAKRYQNDPRVKARHRKYQETPSGKASMERARGKWLENNPAKRSAHIAIGNAVRDGKIQKPDTCQSCGAKPGRIEGHHTDYTKPLEVMWLCRTCHVDQHRKEIA